MPEADLERFARKSWAWFMEYVARSGRDPAQLERSDGMITAIYERRFPFLRDEIVAAQQSLR